MTGNGTAGRQHVVFVDDCNAITRVTRYEKHGRLADMEQE